MQYQEPPTRVAPPPPLTYIPSPPPPQAAEARPMDPAQTTVPADARIQEPIQPQPGHLVPLELPFTRLHIPQAAPLPYEQEEAYFMDDTTQGTIPEGAIEWGEE